MNAWLAQNQEDRIISEWLAKHHPGLVGRVLDIGAHDGWSLSNTARLLERGWGGTLVEASPRPLAKLIDRWGDRDDIDIVGACVVTRENYRHLVPWFDDAGAACHNGEAFLSTTERANVEKWQGATKFRRARLATTGVSELLDDVEPFHVLSIDTEGNSVDVLAESLEYLTPARAPLVLVCEHDDRIPEITKHCAKHDMRIVHTNAENVIAVRE